MKPLLITTLLFSTLIFSAPASAKWTKVTKNTNGDTYYVDFERMRKHEGHVYYWSLTDRLKPNKYGNLSAKIYIQGNCKFFRLKNLRFSSHKKPMGLGDGNDYTPPDKWNYASPKSVDEAILKAVCSR